MITAVIVDDEAHCCETVATLLDEYCPEVELIDICHSGEEALQCIQAKKPQLVFLDIEMPHMTGFELLEKLSVIDFEIVFTTSYDQYAIKAIKLSALDYLLKPIDREELQKAVKKVASKPYREIPQQIEILLQKFHQPAHLPNRIAIPTIEGLRMVAIDSIVSCMASGNYTCLITKSQGKIVSSKTLKEIEEMLEDFSFVRVHNSWMVNINEIEKFIKADGGYLVMSDGTQIDVSRTRRDALLKKLQPGKS